MKLKEANNIFTIVFYFLTHTVQMKQSRFSIEFWRPIVFLTHTVQMKPVKYGNTIQTLFSPS